MAVAVAFEAGTDLPTSLCWQYRNDHLYANNDAVVVQGGAQTFSAARVEAAISDRPEARFITIVSHGEITEGEGVLYWGDLVVGARASKTTANTIALLWPSFRGRYVHLLVCDSAAGSPSLSEAFCLLGCPAVFGYASLFELQAPVGKDDPDVNVPSLAFDTLLDQTLWSAALPATAPLDDAAIEAIRGILHDMKLWAAAEVKRLNAEGRRRAAELLQNNAASLQCTTIDANGNFNRF